MVPVTEDIEVECPQCNQTFTEEIVTSSSSSNGNQQSVSSGSRNSSGPASPVLGASQPQIPVAPQADPFEELMGSILGFGRLFGQRSNQSQVPAQQNGVRRRRIVIDPQGNQTIIEEVTSNNGLLVQRTMTSASSSQQQQQPRQQASSPARNIFILNDPLFSSSMFGNLNLNFRSFAPDENILQHIMRLSEQQMGRTGTPPASESSIKNLPEI